MTRTLWCAAVALVVVGSCASVHAADPPSGAGDLPRCHDPRLVVEPFAAAPDIVHPVAAVFDGRGRLLVIESHTHFAPPNYQGPKHDRIRVLEQ